jgi:hypothetical protein
MLDVRAIYAAYYARHSGDNPGSLGETRTSEEDAFTAVMDRYKTENRRPFPALTEVLEVLRAMGYRNVLGIDPAFVRRAHGQPAAEPVTSEQLDGHGRKIPLATERRSGVSRRRRASDGVQA